MVIARETLKVLATNEAWSAPFECPLMMMLAQSGTPALVTHCFHGEPSLSSAFAMRFWIESGCVIR